MFSECLSLANIVLAFVSLVYVCLLAESVFDFHLLHICFLASFFFQMLDYQVHHLLLHV